MEHLPLDRLPQHSDWVGFLLNSNRDPPGDPEAYTDIAVYDDIYGRLLERYRNSDLDRETFTLETRAGGRDEPDVISSNEDLFLASTEELVAREEDAVRDVLRPVIDGDETVVALGCGWGANLGVIAETFDVTVVGGEIAERGVTLARELHADDDRVSVERFDFFDDWSILDHDEVVVFTRGSLSIIDGVASIIDRLASRAVDGDVVAGVHLEQTGPHPPDTVLGLLRQRYADVRGYDTELLSILRNHDDVAVTHSDYDVVGANPLHPQTAVRWRSA